MYDYSHAPIHGHVIIDEITYPFSVYPEYCSDTGNELDFSGNAHIVALTPRGTMSFLVYNGGEMIHREHSHLFSNLPEKYQNAITDTIERLKPHS